jgi:hypothetical protein
MLERTDLEGDVNRDRLHAILASTSDQTDVVLDHLANARHEAKAAGRPIGTYLVQEFEFRLSRGLNENLRELIRTIQTRHLEEPEVEYRLTAVLMKFGLYDPTAPENTPSKSPRGNPRAVTPSAASATQKSGSEALWVPE